MTNDRKILLGYLEGSLSDPDVERLEKRLSTDKRLREELEQLRSISVTLASARADGFSAFFAERTLKVLWSRAADQAVPLYDALRWVFLRTAVAGLALVILLGVLNVIDYQGLDMASSWIEAAFGLPSTTVEDAFTYGLI